MIIPLHYLPHEIDDAIKNPSLDERSRKILRNLWETFEALEEENRDLDMECRSLESQLSDVEKDVDELHKALDKAEYENKELQRLLDAIEDLLRP